jgi:hypothetical protein
MWAARRRRPRSTSTRWFIAEFGGSRCEEEAAAQVVELGLGETAGALAIAREQIWEPLGGGRTGRGISVTEVPR